MEEKRKFKRLRYGVDVEISYYREEAEDDEILKKLDTDNISAGGIRITIFEKLIPGMIASVSLTMPYSLIEITCLAQVAWVGENTGEGYETGIAFMNLTEDEEKTIDEFVETELEKGIE